MTENPPIPFPKRPNLSVEDAYWEGLGDGFDIAMSDFKPAKRLALSFGILIGLTAGAIIGLMLGVIF